MVVARPGTRFCRDWETCVDPSHPSVTSLFSFLNVNNFTKPVIGRLSAEPVSGLATTRKKQRFSFGLGTPVKIILFECNISFKFVCRLVIIQLNSVYYADYKNY